jgi:hypothetical protein
MIKIAEKITHTIDCGRNTGVLYDVEADTHTTLTHQEILDLPNTLPLGSFVSGEAAHYLAPRTKKSLAQVFTEMELQQFYFDWRDNGITFKMSAQDSAPRARTWALQKGIISNDGGKKGKSDENDTKATAHFLNAHDSVRGCLQNPPKTFKKDPRRLDGEDFRVRLNFNLNVARSEKYNPDELPLAKLMNDNMVALYNYLSPRSREILQLRLDKKTGKRVLKGSINWTTLYSIAGTVFDLECIPMTRYVNKLPGWNFIRRYVLVLGPNHMKAGVAASNIKFHGFRNFLDRDTKDIIDVEFNRTFEQTLRDGNVVQSRIKRGHMTQREDEVFLACRKDFTDMLREVWTFYAELACQNGDYVLCGQELTPNVE